MKRKILTVSVFLAVTTAFILPGLAFGKGHGGNGGGTPSPPPSNPPCDSDHHNGQPPPYGGPMMHTLLCKLQRGTVNATGNATGKATTGQATTGQATTGQATTGQATTGQATTGTTTGATNVCDWNVVLGGMTVIPGSVVPGVLGVHVDLPPDPTLHSTGQLIHACVGVGSVATPPAGPSCPTGTAPIDVQTDQSSFVLLCVLL
jgi:hypothetical protein